MKVLCPLCKTSVDVLETGPFGGSIPPHRVLIRGWARDDDDKRIPADIVYTCVPLDATARRVL